jgi:16S rRNA (cytidine1402-2'-O)-methyltransferase
VESTLYLVSTPIGNLEDITLRAIRILKEVSLILAEDTRHSRILLNHYGISTPTESFHDFNKEKKTPKVIEHLKANGSIALISDAGTPGIADPGFFLCRACRQEGIRVEAIPGASALLCALVASGMPTDRFVFENFPSRKKNKRKTLLASHADSALTHAYYVSPYMVKSFLEDMVEALPQASVMLGRELTKKFEEFQSGTPAQLLKYYSERTPRGEFVFLIRTR